MSSPAMEYKQTIVQAKKNLLDLYERGDDAIGEDALDFLSGLLTPEEITAGDLRVAKMIEVSKARNERGISRKTLKA